ncbi:MAG TPA: endonuclease VII domain-containing protein [Actinomycetales bacterium]|nr:endonuclease VII domain-containing protein [Actinomycetales bacterium]
MRRLKRCPKCKLEKAIEEFGKNSRSKDGLANYCRACFRLIHQDHRERKRKQRGVVRRTPPKVVPEGMKWCPDCDKCLPVARFCKNRRTKTGLATHCRECAAARQIESMRRLHGNARHYHLVRRYGIGEREFDEMVERQNGKCPICRSSLGEKPHVDHDHKTGAIRGILCFNCNAGLGKYGDDPERLVRAAQYLLRTLPAATYVRELDLLIGESFDWMPEGVDVARLFGEEAAGTSQ